MKYNIILTYKGKLPLRSIDAESQDEAKEKAIEYFWDMWLQDPDTILDYIKDGELEVSEEK